VILLDTHMLLLLAGDTSLKLDPSVELKLHDADPKFVSAASLWEIALKFQNGRLTMTKPPSALPDLCKALGIGTISIEPEDSLVELAVLPATKDPFDRLLLAQCQRRDFLLLTTDRALENHPLAWKSLET
jgi:PIN domain nuclease of toxin-antitoxin system